MKKRETYQKPQSAFLKETFDMIKLFLWSFLGGLILWASIELGMYLDGW